jgi:hypothetical protein
LKNDNKDESSLERTKKRNAEIYWKAMLERDG